MKKSRDFLTRLRAWFSKKYILLTIGFLTIFIVLYLFAMFGGMLSSPGFTYAEF